MNTDVQFLNWQNSYHTFLVEMFIILENETKKYKEIFTNKITFEQFCNFVFKNSSKYISPYI